MFAADAYRRRHRTKREMRSIPGASQIATDEGDLKLDASSITDDGRGLSPSHESKMARQK